MTLSLKNKKILLGITGGIAAYKSIELIRLFQAEGAEVDVVLTESAKRFVSSLTLQSLCNGRVVDEVFSSEIPHVRLTSEAHLMVVAPATADIIGKFASGIADDIVSLCFLSFDGPVVFAPAMNWRMYRHPVLQRNIQILKEMGCTEVRPEEGALACGESGRGRMASVDRIKETVLWLLTQKDLEGIKIVVTAGATREPIDPVRFISNRSSGKMGFALARVARHRGAEVVLVSGPTYLEPPESVRFIRVETAEQMYTAVTTHVRDADVLIMAAAVADFTVETPSPEKIDKGSLDTLKLKPTRDIISAVSQLSPRPLIVGFAAETGPNIAKAIEKMDKKGMDILVFNDVTEQGAGFEVDTNKVVIVDREERKELPLMSKEACAQEVLNTVSRLLKARG